MCAPALGSHSPCWIRGWSHRWPVIHASPQSCSMVCANPALSRHGPERPNAGMRSRLQRGFSSQTISHVRPKLASTRGVKFSMIASAPRIRSCRMRKPSGVSSGSVRSRLLVFDTRKCAPRSHHGPSRPVAPPVVRMPSMRVIDSTWMTSAPSAASTPVPAGPAHQAVRSSTRTSSSGSPAPGGRLGALGHARFDGPGVLAEARRAARGGGGSVSSIRHGRRGMVNESVGSRTSTLRSTKCGIVVIVSPLPTGATGMRSSIARSTISAVVVLRREGVHDLVPLLLARDPPDAQCPLVVAQQIEALDEHEEAVELLTAVGREPDVAVEGGLDRRCLEGPFGAGDRWPAGNRPSLLAEARADEGGDLGHRQVDARAVPGLLRAPSRGCGRDRRVRATDPLRDAPTRHDRRLVGRAASGERSRFRLHEDLGDRTLGVRASAPVRCDRHVHDARVTLAQP